MANRRVIISKKPSISLIIVSLASKYEHLVRNQSWPVNLLRTSCGFSILLTTEVVPKIFPNLNVVSHLAVPVGWGSCLPRLAIFETSSVQLRTSIFNMQKIFVFK